MSNAVFPVLPGLTWDVMKIPTWSTRVQQSVSGKEIRLATFSYPIWHFKLIYELLRDDATNELTTLMGFYNQRQGAFDSFLYRDPSDNGITAQLIGIGNGTTTAFQIVRAYGGFVEPIYNLNGSPSIYLNGVLQSSGYNVNSTGLVTFSAAPAAAVAITATFNFYYRVRFKNDLLEFNQFMLNLWELQQCELVSVK